MEQDSLYSCLVSVFASLPMLNEEGYKAIWQNGALRFGNQTRMPDLMDELSSRLACLALSTHQQILIVLPDRLAHRGPLLFASTLLLESLNRVRNHIRGGQVLYFGSTIGIREHLRQIYINNLSLASVFPQTRLQHNLNTVNIADGSKSSKRQSTSSTPFSLPNVLCIYSPGDPIAICQSNKANWIAADCGNESKLRWLRPLVEETKRRNIPLIAWTQNPLSSAVEDFRLGGGYVYTWPAADNQSFPPVGISIVDGLYKIFDSNRQCSIHPIVLENSHNAGIECLHQAYIALSKAASIISSVRPNHLMLRAMQISWRYFRTLENMCVPLNLFESEVDNWWGVSSIERTNEILNKYVDMLAGFHSNFYHQMIEVQMRLQESHKFFERQYPPLWATLPNLCMEPVGNESVRLFVFPTYYSKKLFSLALMAYYNITEDDLKQLHVGLISLRELYDFLTLHSDEEANNGRTIPILDGLSLTKLHLEYWVIGLPSWSLTRYLNPLLCQESFQIIVHSYQMLNLARRVEQWEAAVYPNMAMCADAVAMISKQKRHPIELTSEVPRLNLQRNQKIIVELLDELAQENRISIWEPSDPLEEFAMLMRADMEDDISLFLPKHDDQTGNITAGIDGEFVEEVWVIEFRNGQYVLLNLNEKVNVIVSTSGGFKTDERFVSSLRASDRIVFIHGQHRQSILSLIISRVYHNPSISLHVKLVERWQDDFISAYQHRTQSIVGWNINKLFGEMKARGSLISDPQPLRNWLHRETLRPQDQEDLRRIAEILELDFIRQHYKRIHQAGSRLAGLHVSLSRRLNSWLNHQAPNIVANVDDEDDIIDEQLGLTFQDFRDSLSVLQVKSVQKEKGLFSRDMLGSLEKESMS